MNKKLIEFRKRTSEMYSIEADTLLSHCFEYAVRYASEGNQEISLKIAEPIKHLLPFSSIGTAKLYIVGFLCDLYLNTNDLEQAEASFKIGMNMIKYHKNEFDEEDINSFLDMKIDIEKLKKNKTKKLDTAPYVKLLNDLNMSPKDFKK